MRYRYNELDIWLELYFEMTSTDMKIARACVTIIQKYLTKGYTKMEVDLMNSSIGRVLKNTKDI